MTLQGEDAFSTVIDPNNGNTIIPFSEETTTEIGDVTIYGTMVFPIPVTLLAVEPPQEIINEMEVELENDTVTPIDGDTTLLLHETPYAPMLSQS